MTLLGYLVILASAIMKLPQLLKILQSGSVNGLSKYSCYFEIFIFFNTLAKAIHIGLTFSVYGDMLLMSIQSGLVILCYFNYDKTVSNTEKIVFTGGFALYATILLTA